MLNAKQLATQIPWGHNLLIVSRSKNHEEALFYVQKTIENNWSRAVLTHQIEGNLFGREGKALTNFSVSLPDELKSSLPTIEEIEAEYSSAKVHGSLNVLEDGSFELSNLDGLTPEIISGF